MALQVDAAVNKVNGILSQVSGIDKAYRFIIYTLRIVASTTASRYGDKHPLVQRIANLTSPLADTRMVLRAFGFLPILQALVKSILLKSPSSTEKSGIDNDEAKISAATKPLFLQQIEELQLYSMLIYYPAEHIYWLGAHKVLDVKDPDRWSRWSCRAWAAYIVLDIMAIAYQMRPILTKIRNLRTFGVSNTGSGSANEELKRAESELEDYRLQLVSLIADLPLAVHWSLESYPLPNLWVGVFGVISTVASAALKWKYAS